MAHELVTAKDLQATRSRVAQWIFDGKSAKVAGAFDTLIERIDRADTELAALRAKVARLEAPVSDAEWELTACKLIDEDILAFDGCRVTDAIIAARAKEQP